MQELSTEHWLSIPNEIVRFCSLDYVRRQLLLLLLTCLIGTTQNHIIALNLTSNSQLSTHYSTLTQLTAYIISVTYMVQRAPLHRPGAHCVENPSMELSSLVMLCIYYIDNVLLWASLFNAFNAFLMIWESNNGPRVHNSVHYIH